jgi:amidase
VTDAQVALWGTAKQAAAIRGGQLGARELVHLYAARIDRLNPAVNAVVTFDLDRALEDAARIDERVARGAPVGGLAGIPMTIKDAIEVGGMLSTSGATELRDHVPVRDAPAVSSLRAAGAIIVGKTNCPAWCSGDSETNNELFGTTNNPWDLERTVGGSSGGSAAAVAAGLSSCDLGTDIGGSIRIPSHYCGVYGLKPSFGVVPQLGYLSHVGSGRIETDMNHFGPIARSPDDLELLLDVLAGPAPGMELAWKVDLPAPRFASLDRLRVGVWFDEPDCPVAAEYLALLTRAADALGAEGCQVDESHPAVGFDELVELWLQLVSAAVSPGLPTEIAEAAGGPHLQWLRNQERRADLVARWHSWFGDHDALLCPVVLGAATPHDLEGDMLERTIDVDGTPRSAVFEVPRWCALLNVVGFPSCVVPIGQTDAGLPVGMQIVTASLRDREAIELARRLEQIIGGYEPPPLAL